MRNLGWMKRKTKMRRGPDGRAYPLRKVLGRVEVPVETASHVVLIEELYECGHTRLPKQDIIGETNAVRRRCRDCALGKAPDQKYLKMAQGWDS